MTSSSSSSALAGAAREVKYVPYQPPLNPSILDHLLHVPRSAHHFVWNLSNAFGAKYIFVLFAICGLQQGFGVSYFFQARDYYFKDVSDLSPGEAQILTSSSFVPWNIKPLYGMWADTIAVMGFHRTPLIILSGLVGTLSLVTLSIVHPAAHVEAFFITGNMLSMALSDTVGKASVAENVVKYPGFGSDLQALCWGSMAFGCIIGFGTSGFLIQALGPGPVFGILTFTSLSVLISGSLGFFGESKTTATPTKTLCNVICWYDTNYNQNKQIFRLSAILSAMAVFVGLAVVIIHDWYARFSIIFVVAIAIPGYFYYDNIMHEQRDIANCGVFLFIMVAITPEITTTMFYWYTKSEDGPKFSPVFVGIINMCGYIFMLIGIGLYNRYMTRWQFKKIFITAQLILFFCGIFDIIVVTRANTKIHIPDELIVFFSDTTLTGMMLRLLYIPMFVLAARVCPPGAEATLFAMFTSLINFGNSVAIYFGSFWVFVLGITDTNYDNFIYLILIRCFFRLVPIPFIYYLVTRGTPAEAEKISEVSITPQVGFMVPLSIAASGSTFSSRVKEVEMLSFLKWKRDSISLPAVPKGAVEKEQETQNVLHAETAKQL